MAKVTQKTNELWKPKMYWTEYLIIVRAVASSPWKTEKQPENLSVKTAKSELERTSKMVLDIINENFQRQSQSMKKH